MVPEVPLKSRVWQIYASVMKRLLTGLSSECSVESVLLAARYHAYAHLLILSFSPPGL